MITYNSIDEVKQAVKNGKKVNWQNGNYYVKLLFDGDFVVKCESSPIQELLTNDYKPSDFFTQNI